MAIPETLNRGPCLVGTFDQAVQATTHFLILDTLATAAEDRLAQAR